MKFRLSFWIDKHYVFSSNKTKQQYLEYIAAHTKRDGFMEMDGLFCKIRRSAFRMQKREHSYGMGTVQRAFYGRVSETSTGCNVTGYFYPVPRFSPFILPVGYAALFARSYIGNPLIPWLDMLIWFGLLYFSMEWLTFTCSIRYAALENDVVAFLSSIE